MIGPDFNIALSTVGFPPDSEQWTLPIQKEIQHMTKFHIFGPPQYPPSDATILFPLWVFVHKIDSDG